MYIQWIFGYFLDISISNPYLGGRVAGRLQKFGGKSGDIYKCDRGAYRNFSKELQEWRDHKTCTVRSMVQIMAEY